nr:ATP-binding protein [Thiomonas sp. X19]
MWNQEPGLPHGRERAVFEKFTRGEPESPIPGVDLAICRVIVEARGGTITAANQPMGGAAFSVRLPLQAAPQLEPGGDAEHQAEAETDKSPASAATDPAALASGPTAALPASPELP